MLIDSSLWIEVLQKGGKRELRDLVENLIMEGRIVTCGIVKIEVLQGVKDVQKYKRLKKLFSGLIEYPLDVRVSDLASEIAWTMRRKGKPQPVTDIIISAISIVNNLELWHLDFHFTEISKFFPLKEKNLIKI